MGIADAILTQIQQAGQPRTVTQKETVTAKEPIDIGGLGLLLYMLMEMQAGQPQTQLGVTGLPAAGAMGAGIPGLAPGAFTSSPFQAAGQGYGAMDPMQLIMSIFGGAAGAPGMGG